MKCFVPFILYSSGLKYSLHIPRSVGQLNILLWLSCAAQHPSYTRAMSNILRAGLTHFGQSYLLSSPNQPCEQKDKQAKTGVDAPPLCISISQDPPSSTNVHHGRPTPPLSLISVPQCGLPLAHPSTVQNWQSPHETSVQCLSNRGRLRPGVWALLVSSREKWPQSRALGVRVRRGDRVILLRG